MVRMTPAGELSVEVLKGLGDPGGGKSRSTWLLVHKGHMRLLSPRGAPVSPPTVREVLAAGWECHLEAAEGSEASVRARDYLSCPRCDQQSAEDVARTGRDRPPPVFGLHAFALETRAGQWTPSPLELKDWPDPSSVTRQELLEWLGDQGPFFEVAAQRGLDFLEVYAGVVRATAAVRQFGGTALCLGLDTVRTSARPVTALSGERSSTSFARATSGVPSHARRSVRGSAWRWSATATWGLASEKGAFTSPSLWDSSSGNGRPGVTATSRTRSRRPLGPSPPPCELSLTRGGFGHGSTNARPACPAPTVASTSSRRSSGLPVPSWPRLARSPVHTTTLTRWSRARPRPRVPCTALASPISSPRRC